MRTWRQPVAALATLLALGAAVAQTGAPAPPPGTGARTEARQDEQVARGDRKFMERAVEAGLFEVQAAQLASTRSKDPQVQALANRLGEQRAKANDELIRLADARGVELPAAPPRGQRNAIDKLGRKQGEALDRAFVQEVGIDANEKSARVFEKAAKEVRDPELRAWVERTLPLLREHLAAARQLAGAADPAASMGAKKTGS